ncbi:retinoic acid-induced protein 1 [Polypterus senegalus]|uniref:retinoic acid-induced protein 1 n=1 Tax=Polypterus senegalus TaxID=55291 RepID=UPI0019652422|nr:retinoic acid-induced protein 1 [Polypterus senegalus]
MQSFRERSGFHGNQPCYQQENPELSHLENYRPHQSQARRGYGPQSLPAAKDCYNQQAYASYRNNAAADKPYKVAKIHAQHLQRGYGTQLSNAYSAQYLPEGQMHPKWEDSSHLPQYEQESTGGNAQYLEQHLHPISRSLCSHSAQPNPTAYTSHHQQKVQQDTSSSSSSSSSMTYTQGSLHFPQQSQSLSSSTASYPAVEKCNQANQCYKGYSMPTNPPYNRQLASSSIKQAGYRTQGNYSYQPTPTRTAYDQQNSLQAMPSAQESLSKYQHYSQAAKNYCVTDMSVRSPEQYYQNCSPSSSHSPARSVGRSPSYSSTPSPLMINPETFQYNQTQPPIATGASSSVAMREQSLLMPPHSHSSSSLNPQTTNYAGSLKDRFSEKLLSNPSLWSLNALTSQVENISNNVQQLLLSEALISSKKSGKRAPKKVEDFKGQQRILEDSGCTESQQATAISEPFSTPQSVPTEMQEGDYSSSSEDQLERSYYLCRQNASPAQISTNLQLTLETVSSSSVTSPGDMSTKSDDSLHSLQSGEPGENFTAFLKNMENEKPSKELPVPSPLKQDSSQDSMTILKDALKENFEETPWPDRTKGEEEEMNDPLISDHDEKDEICGVDQEAWPEDEKYPAFFHKLSKALINKSYSNNIEEKLYQEMQIHYITDEPVDCTKSASPEEFNGKTGSDVEVEMYNSELPTDLKTSEKADAFSWNDDLVEDQYLAVKEEVSDYSHFNSRSEIFDAKLLTSEQEQLDTYVEECSVQTPDAGDLAEVLEEKEDFEPPQEDTCRGPGSPSDQPGGNQTVETMETCSESSFQETPLSPSQQGSLICDLSPSNNVTLVNSADTEDKVTCLEEECDSEDVEESTVMQDASQTPEQTAVTSAPSWDEKPPSPKTWEEDTQCGISFQSEELPPPEPNAHQVQMKLNPLNRIHGEEKPSQQGKLLNTSVRIRRLSSLVGEDLPANPRISSMPPSKSVGSIDQAGTASKNLASQALKHFAEKVPSRMCTRSFSALIAPKACLLLKRQSSPNFPKRASSKDLAGHTKKVLPKIKRLKHKAPKSHDSHLKCKRSTNEGNTKGDSSEETPNLRPLQKDQRPMVLRSRKQKDEKPIKEELKEKKMTGFLPKNLKTSRAHKIAFLKGQTRASSKKKSSRSHRKVVFRIKSQAGKPNEKILSPMKRKSTCHSPVPIKRQKSSKPAKSEDLKLPLKNKFVVPSAPGKTSRRGNHLKASINTYIVKETANEKNGGPPCIQAQCPAKTKYLPPRKGRGLKYEALVQKMTSPGSKKHVINNPTDTADPTTTSSILNVDEKVPVKQVDDGEPMNVAGATDADPLKSYTSRKKKLLVFESTDQPAVELKGDSLLVTTPRLAKQRAIKNNHEMHLKQRRKRRKSCGPLPEMGAQDSLRMQDHLAPPAAEPPTEKPVTKEAIVIKRSSRRLLPAKSQAGLSLAREQQKPEETNLTGKLRRSQKLLCAVKTRKNGHRLKTRHRKQCAPIVEEKEPEIRLKYATYRPQKMENKLPLFCPFVRVDRSSEFATICTVINRPEEELRLHQMRKKMFSQSKNIIGVAKLIPNSSVLQQGPLVNKKLTDRCLTCCLCGKPANYRELGDLCGPYYPEDSIPRKTLSFLKCKSESGENPIKMLCSPIQIDHVKKAGAKGGNSTLLGKPRRQERTGEHSVIRSKIRERYRKRHQFQGQTRKAPKAETGLLSNSDGANQQSQHLEFEAESKEHWVHEACAVWTGGVFLVTGKLYGLQEAALAASVTACATCQELGASIECFWKACTKKFHYVCAKDSGCLMLEDNFTLKCPKHQGTSC